MATMHLRNRPPIFLSSFAEMLQIAAIVTRIAKMIKRHRSLYRTLIDISMFIEDIKADFSNKTERLTSMKQDDVQELFDHIFSDEFEHNQLPSKNQYVVLKTIHELGNKSYGDEISKYIEAHSSKTITLGQIYTSLKKLLKDKYTICDESETPTNDGVGRPRRYYTLTERGKRILSFATEMFHPQSPFQGRKFNYGKEATKGWHPS